MARTKGTCFVALKSFITRRFGYDDWRRYLSLLEPKDRRLAEMPSAKEWYDLEAWFRALHVLADNFGDSPKEVVLEFGRHEAERDLSGIQRLFLRLANPAFVLEKAGEYWKNFCDFGEWKIERVENGARAELAGVPLLDELYCTELLGYLGRMMELVGAKNVKAEHSQCRARGDEKCIFVGSWS
jgi:predicted hydrocarbon binding protein